jgi:hypothetical protein
VVANAMNRMHARGPDDRCHGVQGKETT